METAFFRYVSPLEGHEALELGDCIAAYMTREAGEEPQWCVKVAGRMTYIFTSEEMRAHFTPITESEFQAALNSLLGEVNGLVADQSNLEREITAASTHALNSGESSADAGEPGQESETQNTALARAPAGGLRNRALALKRRMVSLSETLKSRQQKITTMMEQRMAGIGAIVSTMQTQIAKLEEVVWMVNLYLGRDEEITVLRSGAKAPAGTPITLRQSVLYMDEEVALEHSHGIDFSEISAFDNWLLEGDNLRQVMPEPKGVVVLQVRRNPKDYDISRESLSQALRDSIEASEKNRLNMMSYWLIRNGENLYRLWTDIRVGERLIPTLAEFDGFFQSPRFGREHEPIRPGSKEYYKAMERANGLNRHYMRLGLVLQGLIDRTQVFAPFKDNLRPNIIDERTWNDQVKIIRDEEGTVTDGRPSFSTWLRSINRDLHPGLRVVAGRWKIKTYSRDDYEAERQHPRNASGPSSEGVYTLARVRRGLGFLYDRTDKVWVQDRRYYGRTLAEAKRKASYMVYSTDDFFVCIDNVHDLAEIEYYLNDRRHRREYENMVPLLKRVLEFKREEQAAEAPFRALLLQKLNEAHPSSPCDEATLNRLIQWWKARRSDHRALLSDDQQAYQDIMAEYARQFGGNTARASEKDQDAIATFAGQPDTLALWARGSGSYCVLRSIPGQPIFCHLETHARRRTGWTLTDRREWVIPRKYDFLRWTPLHVTTEWNSRPEAPEPSAFLPSPVFERLVQWVRSAPNPVGSEDSTSRLLAVYAYQTTKGTSIRATWWAPDDRAFGGWMRSEQESPTLMGYRRLPDFRERLVRWKHSEDGHSFSFGYESGTQTWLSNRHRDFEFRRAYAEEDAILLYLDEAGEKQLLQLATEATAHNERRDQLHDWALGQNAAAGDYLLERWKQRETEKYLTEGGDPEFAEDHLRTLRKPQTNLDHGFTDLLHECLNKVDGDIARLTAAPLARVLADLLPTKDVTDAQADSPPLRELIGTDWALSPQEDGPED